MMTNFFMVLSLDLEDTRGREDDPQTGSADRVRSRTATKERRGWPASLFAIAPHVSEADRPVAQARGCMEEAERMPRRLPTEACVWFW